MSYFLRGFIVSNITNNSKEIDGFSVKQIQQLENKDVLIFIATSEKYQYEIIDLLKRLGFGNILAVQGIIWECLFNCD